MANATESKTTEDQRDLFNAAATGTDPLTIAACTRTREYVGRVRSRVPGFVNFTCAPNIQCQKGYAGVPRGGVALYRSETPMSVDFFDGQSDFAGTSLYAVVGGMDDYSAEIVTNCHMGGGLEGTIPHLDRHYKGYCEQGPRLECMDRSAGDTLQDASGQSWTGAMDNPESFVGLYSMAMRPQLGPAEETYVIVVGNVGAGYATEEMYSLAETFAEQGKTFQQFVDSAEYKYVQRLAQRNRNRVAAIFAKACGLQIRTIPDLFSAEKRQKDEQLLQRGALQNKRNLAKYKEGILKIADYIDVAGTMRSGTQRQIVAAIDKLVVWGVTPTPELLHWLTTDPEGLQGENPHVDRSMDDAGTGATNTCVVPVVGDPFSETINHRIVISGKSALLYRDVTPQYLIGDGQGVAMTLSPAEGLMVLHGNDRRENARAPFGNGDPAAGCFHISPVTSGRLRSVSDISWSEHAQAASTAAPGFLCWQSERQDICKNAHPEGLLTGKVPHARALTGQNRCIYRSINAQYQANLERLSTAALRMQGCTRLDPLAVVMYPQPLRDFPNRVIPTF